MRLLGTINDLKASAKSFSTNSTALFGGLSGFHFHTLRLKREFAAA